MDYGKGIVRARERPFGIAIGVAFIARGEQDYCTILGGDLIEGTANVARPVVRSHVAAKADADNTRFALSLGIVGNVFCAIDDRGLR